MQHGIADLASGQVAAAGNFAQKPVIHGMALWQVQIPDPKTFSRLGLVKIHHHIHAPHESVVDALAGIGGHNQYSVEVFQPLQEKVCFQVGIAVIRGLHAGPLG